jgi:hypothetical protein
MLSVRTSFLTPPLLRFAGMFLLLVPILCLVPGVLAQETPLLSGGVGFFSRSNGGDSTFVPVIAPVLAAPLGNSFLVESRATILESFFPKGGGQSGYDHAHFSGAEYMQLDYLATSHLTVVGGLFLTPFGTYNERLSPIWIGNFQDAPIIFPIGIGTGSGLGGMVRGSAISTENYSVDYAAYFSANSTNANFPATRSTGGRVDVYFPKLRLEMGTSYTRSLAAVETNSFGFDVWWEPPSSELKVRSEYAHSAHAQGYWMEMDYRLSRFGGRESVIGRMEPIFRWQQFFRNSPDPTDGLPATDMNRVEFGLDYRLPHEIRILTSYGRQFTPVGDSNMWRAGIVYRFLFPAWKGKS